MVVLFDAHLIPSPPYEMSSVWFSVGLLIAVFSCSGYSQPQIGPLPQPYSTPESCSLSVPEFYHTGNLSCVPCGDNQVVAENGECANGYD